MCEQHLNGKLTNIGEGKYNKKQHNCNAVQVGEETISCPFTGGVGQFTGQLTHQGDGSIYQWAANNKCKVENGCWEDQIEIRGTAANNKYE